MEREPEELKLAFRALRKLPSVDPAARAWLSQRLANEPMPRAQRFALPRSVRLALAAGVCALMLTAGGLTFITKERGAGTVIAAGDETRPVQFVIVAAEARSVSLVGDFNDWDPDAVHLERGAGGVWSVVLPLPSGQFTYSFLVDGEEWRADPAAPRASGEDFGRPSSVVFVPGGTS